MQIHAGRIVRKVGSLLGAMVLSLVLAPQARSDPRDIRRISEPGHWPECQYLPDTQGTIAELVQACQTQYISKGYDVSCYPDAPGTTVECNWEDAVLHNTTRMVKPYKALETNGKKSTSSPKRATRSAP